MTEQKNRAGYCSLAALRYAEVLYQLKVPEEAIGETKRLWEVSEELPEVLSNPAVSKEQKHGIIDRIFPKEMRSFLKVLVDHEKAGILESYQLSRILVWKNPEAYPRDGGYQVLQGLYAIGSGGLLGKGLGQSIQKLSFLPEPQNDMIFAIICEELGLFGAISVILIFLFMIYRFMLIAGNAPDLFGALLVVGVMAHIAIQVILNIAVVTNVIPNTGITLPFISYGGTSVLFLMVEMGMALSVSNQIKLER